jgi:hypothetical protein
VLLHTDAVLNSPSFVGLLVRHGHLSFP